MNNNTEAIDAHLCRSRLIQICNLFVYCYLSKKSIDLSKNNKYLVYKKTYMKYYDERIPMALCFTDPRAQKCAQQSALYFNMAMDTEILIKMDACFSWHCINKWITESQNDRIYVRFC